MRFRAYRGRLIVGNAEASSNMAFSSSRGIMYTAPPRETDRTESNAATESERTQSTSNTAAVAPADD